MTSTADQIALVFSVDLGIEVPDYDLDIIEQGLLDSLILVTLLVEIEHRFGIELPLDAVDIDRLSSINRIAGLVDELRNDDAEQRTPPGAATI